MLKRLRKVLQFTYLILVLVGLYMEVRIIIPILMITPFVMGNFFCGWICPFGTVQEYFSRIGTIFFRKKIKPPRWVQNYIQWTKYIIFIGILIIFGNKRFMLPFDSYKAFMGYFSGIGVQTTAFVFLILFLLIALFIERPFCNYFCVEGARYGLSSFSRLFTITRDNKICIRCKKCDKVCPMNINISERENIRNIQCINCFICIDKCPIKGTLKYKFYNYFKSGKR